MRTISCVADCEVWSMRQEEMGLERVEGARILRAQVGFQDSH